MHYKVEKVNEPMPSDELKTMLVFFVRELGFELDISISKNGNLRFEAVDKETFDKFMKLDSKSATIDNLPFDSMKEDITI